MSMTNWQKETLLTVVRAIITVAATIFGVQIGM